MKRVGGGLLLLWCFLLLGGMEAWAQPSCRKVLGNRQGAAKADIPVSTTAVTVALANTSRCSLLIYNNSGNDMRCSDTNDGTPTPTTGIVIPAGQGRGFELGGQGEWKCIRTGAADAAANVAEELP